MLTKQEESIFRSKLGLTIMKYFGISFVIALASGVATTLLLNCFIRENGISGETVELLSYMVTIAVLFVVFLKLFHKNLLNKPTVVEFMIIPTTVSLFQELAVIILLIRAFC